MCLILAAVAPRPRTRLLLLANRDEFHARPSAAAAPWEADPRVVGGRDLVAGGSWLAVRADGRLAAVTNIRRGDMAPAPRSRGELVSGFVESDTGAGPWLRQLAGRVEQYAPFNLLLGDAEGFTAFDGNSGRSRPLGPGLHALSNGSLDDSWPKMRRVRELVGDALAADASPGALLDLLLDTRQAPDAELPDTGFGLERERLLSPIFIRGVAYGTRACSLLEILADGSLHFVERRFGPGGVATGGSAWAYQPGQPGWQATASS